MASLTQPVPCQRCGRTVQVALSPLHPPCFQQIDEQVECPEIQQRRGKNGEGALLLMMCSALKRSLDARCESAQVEATDQDGRRWVVCRIPGVPNAHYTAQEARNRAEVWEAHGHKQLAVRLRAAAAKAERAPLSRVRIAIGLGAVVIAAAGGWFMLTRASVAPPPQPQVAQQPVEITDARPDPKAVELPAPAAAVTQDASPAANPAAATPPDTPSASSTESHQPEPEPAPVQSQPPAVEKPTTSTAEAAALARAAVAADPTPAAGPTPVADWKPHEPVMVPIFGGTFAMGGVDPSELPVHQVTVKPFALGKFPVTVGEWKECVVAKACADIATGSDDNPVTNISYNDTQDYLTWLSRVTGKPYRLPSEAEWEYAARGGKHTKFWWGDEMRAGMADCKGCNKTSDATQPMRVGSFQQNPFGLFDMGGGVDQWVADSWHKNYQGAPSDGSAWVDAEGFARVIRSGSWKNDPSYVRPGSRDHYDTRVRYPTHGFRVALPL